jgi:microbial collagenase
MKLEMKWIMPWMLMGLGCAAGAVAAPVAEMGHAAGLPGEAPQAQAAAESKQLKADPNCNAAYMAGLSGAAFVDFIVQADYDCLRPLFFFNEDTAAVVSEANVQLMVDDIFASTADVVVNAKRITQALTFLHVAFYQDYYAEAVAYSSTVRNAAINALLGVAADPHFVDPTETMAAMRSEWVVALDNMDGNLAGLGTYQTLLARFNGDPALATGYNERLTVYYILNALAWRIEDSADLGINSPWYNAIPNGIVNQIAAIAVDTAHIAAAEYLVNNAIWTLGHFSYCKPGTYALAHAAVTTSYQDFASPAPPWVWSYVVLRDFFGATQSGGAVLDTATIEADTRAYVLPTAKSYDLGRLEILTNMGDAETDALYDSLQVLESQFFRLSGRLLPVNGDPNAQAGVVVFGSDTDYDTFTTMLFGVENIPGGTYDEASGLCLTYRRGAGDPWTTEDGVRHEYTHYLDARYNVPGTWGAENVVHGDARLHWYTEGLAEFLSGSTRLHGVLPREVDASFAADATRDFSIAELIRFTAVDTFEAYPYLALFFNFLYSEQPKTLTTLMGMVQSGNAHAVASFAETLANDADLQLAFAAYLAGIKADFTGGTGSFADDYPTETTPGGLPADNGAAIQSHLEAAGDTGAPHLYLTGTRYIYTDRITLTTAAAPADRAEALRVAFTEEMNNRLTTLQPMLLNFANATGWFGTMNVSGANGTATICIEGPYQGAANWNGMHKADTVPDHVITLSELLRVIQFYNAGGLHCEAGTEDGYGVGAGATACAPHASDYNPQNWAISLTELLRLIQFYNAGGYYGDFSSEDGFAPGGTK